MAGVRKTCQLTFSWTLVRPLRGQLVFCVGVRSPSTQCHIRIKLLLMPRCLGDFDGGRFVCVHVPLDRRPVVGMSSNQRHIPSPLYLLLRMNYVDGAHCSGSLCSMHLSRYRPPRISLISAPKDHPQLNSSMHATPAEITPTTRLLYSGLP